MFRQLARSHGALFSLLGALGCSSNDAPLGSSVVDAGPRLTGGTGLAGTGMPGGSPGAQKGGGGTTGGIPADGGAPAGGDTTGGIPAHGGAPVGGDATGGTPADGGAPTGGDTTGGTPAHGGAPVGGDTTGGTPAHGGAPVGGTSVNAQGGTLANCGSYQGDQDACLSAGCEPHVVTPQRVSSAGGAGGAECVIDGETLRWCRATGGAGGAIAVCYCNQDRGCYLGGINDGTTGFTREWLNGSSNPACSILTLHLPSCASGGEGGRGGLAGSSEAGGAR